MKSSTLSACNRYASTVDLKAAANAPNIVHKHASRCQCACEIYKEVSLMRRLVSLRQLLEQSESEGTNPDTIFVDPADTCTFDLDELQELIEDQEED